MCGIAGFVGKGTQDDLSKMVQAIKHRGPDDQGFLVKDNVGLGHARLSIIDLSPAGHQPMTRGNLSLVFNGEIYNFKVLRKELERSGLKFSSNSDTEVVLLGFELWGLGIFAKLRGMFAIALYDFGKKQLILARDPLGKKPLYWVKFSQAFLFGSELKALIAHPAFVKELDQESLAQYFIHECVPTPKSIWAGVSKLEPGSHLVYDGQNVTKDIFWRPNYTEVRLSQEASPPRGRSDLRAKIKELDNLLAKATEARLISDVPLGVFLSGGIDSSTVAYYAQKASAQKIKTFSIGFEEKSYDESNYARLVAKHLGTNHHEQYVTAKDMFDVVPLVAEIFDEPVADASVIPTYLLSKFTREKVTVALGGDGGDELFEGYQTFIAEQFKLFFPIIRLLGYPVTKLLPKSSNYFSLDFKISKFLDGAGATGAERHSRWLAAFQPEEIRKLMDYELRIMNYESIPEFYLRRYLMDQVLVKVDRASMRSALETRAPFLDTRVVDFANSLPHKYKVRGITTKYILKKLMQDKLPSEVVWRKKKGFAVPLSNWLRHELRDLCNDLLAPDKLNREAIFNSDYVEKLKKDHFAGQRNNSKKLWTLMTFELWRDRWL